MPSPLHAVELAARAARRACVVAATEGKRDPQVLRAALALDAHCVPAGYPISASTPDEIGLSVLAAVVAERRGAARDLLRVGAADPPPVAVVTTLPEGAGSVADPDEALCSSEPEKHFFQGGES